MDIEMSKPQEKPPEVDDKNERKEFMTELAVEIEEQQEKRRRLTKAERKLKAAKYAYKKNPDWDVISMQEIYDLGMKLNEEDRFLFWLLYLTSGRVSEVLSLLGRQIKFEEDKMVITLLNLKNKKDNRKDVPIKLNGINPDSNMGNFIALYIKERHFQEFEYIIPFSQKKKHGRATIWNHLTKNKNLRTTLSGTVWVKEEDGRMRKDNIVREGQRITPHYLRKCRLTHMVSQYDFDESRLTKMAGWTTLAPASYYIRLNSADIYDKMR